MSLPPVIPEQTTSGIAVDPVTLSRVVPESRRPDGSVRKEIRIRPGFTPQEDVSRFRSTRQQQIERNALPKGHILGWVAPSSESSPKSKEGDKTKSQKKNEKRKAKREQKKQDIIKASWEDDEDDHANPATTKESKPAKSSTTPAHGKATDDILELDIEMKNMEIHEGSD